MQVDLIVSFQMTTLSLLYDFVCYYGVLVFSNLQESTIRYMGYYLNFFLLQFFGVARLLMPISHNGYSQKNDLKHKFFDRH